MLCCSTDNGPSFSSSCTEVYENPKAVPALLCVFATDGSHFARFVSCLPTTPFPIDGIKKKKFAFVSTNMLAKLLPVGEPSYGPDVVYGNGQQLVCFVRAASTFYPSPHRAKEHGK